jgi:hypothetical protein
VEPDDLYGLQLQEFTSARDALAKQLRGSGDPDAAAAVRKLRKPNLTAWALNHLARRERSAIDALLTAGERLRSGQRKVMSGGKPDDLRAATEERKRIVSKLVKAAESILTESGHAASSGTLSGVHDSLMAAATDDEGAGRLRRGVLERELLGGEIPDITGFAVIQGGRSKAAPARAPTQPKTDRRLQDARRNRDRAAEAAAELGRQAEAAEQTAARLEVEVAEAEGAVEEATRRLDEAKTAAGAARRSAAEAHRQADRVRAEHEAAQRELAEAERKLAEVEP